MTKKFRAVKNTGWNTNIVGNYLVVDEVGRVLENHDTLEEAKEAAKIANNVHKD